MPVSSFSPHSNVAHGHLGPFRPSRGFLYHRFFFRASCAAHGLFVETNSPPSFGYIFQGDLILRSWILWPSIESSPSPALMEPPGILSLKNASHQAHHPKISRRVTRIVSNHGDLTPEPVVQTFDVPMSGSYPHYFRQTAGSIHIGGRI